MDEGNSSSISGQFLLKQNVDNIKVFFFLNIDIIYIIDIYISFIYNNQISYFDLH